MSEVTHSSLLENYVEDFSVFVGHKGTTALCEEVVFLRDKALLLGGETEKAVCSAVRSLTERDSDLARAVSANDALIDRLELEIDRLYVEVIASERLCDEDLRLAVSVSKITPILERIADHAASIAEAAIYLNNEPQVYSYFEISRMAGIAGEMLRDSLNSFTSKDSISSRAIITRDVELDKCYSGVFEGLVRTMVHNPAAANGAARLLFVAKHLERIGDYVKDICELNVYLTEAVFIKHGYSR